MGQPTFRREAHVPRGGPDGGDGGRGGSIHLRVDAGQTTLRDFQYKHHFKATPGGRGEGARRHGKAGTTSSSTCRPARPSSMTRPASSSPTSSRSASRSMVARGGRGGLGNTHFESSTHQAPKHAQKGEPGEERWVRLELRLIADIGLVGLPNAGKSTLLAALTAATPKIADYPFTTLEPNLGVIDLGDEDGRRPTIADVPGLIEGASGGAGLGHAFLRHVERTRVLVHVVDGSARDPEWDHEVIREELRAHDPALLEKPILVAFNKIDLPGAGDAWPAFRAARTAEGLDVLAISATAGEGLDAFRARIVDLLPSADELAEPPEPPASSSTGSTPMGDGFAVEAEEPGVFRVRGKRIERIAAQTNFEVEESAERFQRDLARLGVDAELRRAGIQPGDLVRVGTHGARMGGRGLGGALKTGVSTTGRAAPVRPGSVGVLGGTFDPIHLAHLAVAEEAREALGLERILFVPAAMPPHKVDRPVSTAQHRLAMVELAIAGNPAFEASRIELDRQGPSYTVDTLEALSAAGSREVVLIMSAEAFRELRTWRRPSESSSWPSSRSCRATATPTSAGRSSPNISRATRTEPSFSRVRGCASRPPRSASERSMAGPSATSSRMRSRRISATMPCTAIHCGGRTDCDGLRAARCSGRTARRRPAPSRRAGPRDRSRVPRSRAAHRRAGRGQEGRGHRPARSDRADDPRGLLRHLLRRLGAPARCDRGRHHLHAP